MPNIGLTKTQADALNRHLACGKPSLNGFVLAAKQFGLFENFMGRELVLADAVTRTFLSIDPDLDPYYVRGANQSMALRVSDAATPDGNPCANSGLVIASTTTPACLRLTGRDVNGKFSVGVSQEGSLWLTSSTAWSAHFEMTVPKNAYAVGVAFQEVGLMGAGDIATHFIDASKEFGYVDGSADEAFVSLKFYNGSGYLRARGAAGGTIVTSGAFAIPTSGKHVYRLEYGYASSGGTPGVALFIDDVFVASVTVTISSALQFAARACHGASYLAASHVPPVLDINTIAVAAYSA